MAVIHEQGIPRPTAGRHLRAGIATSRERDRREMVYTWKTDEQGWVLGAKPRLVARGFKQREGIDFGEMFAPPF